MRAGTIRTTIIALMSAELIYMSFWAGIIIIVKAGLWTHDWLGFDGDNIVGAASAFQIGMVFVVTSLILLSLLLIIRFSKFTLYAYLCSIIAHFIMWISLLDNDYYSGGFGFYVIMVEAAVTILILNLPKKTI